MPSQPFTSCVGSSPSRTPAAGFHTATDTPRDHPARATRLLHRPYAPLVVRCGSEFLANPLTLFAPRSAIVASGSGSRPDIRSLPW